LTTRAVTPRVLAPPARVGTGVSVYPSATAMVWPGSGHAHEAVAVPGVRLGTGEILVEVELATICGSDVHTTRGDRSAPTPLVLGHEQLGRVVALGHAGAKSTDGRRLAIGARVVWSVAVPCGRCPRCRRGLPQKCVNLQKYGHERMRRGWELSGGFATHVHVLAGTPIVVVPADIPAEVLAPASCATATAAAALEAAAEVTQLRESVLVIAGAGMLGLTAAAMASDAGARVVVTDSSAARREAALAFGAHAVADPFAVAPHPASLVAAIARAGGRGSTCTVALEMSGAPSAVRTLLDTVDVGGVLVLVGPTFPAPDFAINPEQFVRRLLTIRGVHNYAPRHLERAVAYLTDAWQRFPFAEQVGRTLPLASVDEALALAAAGVAPRIAISARR
jgi:putative phosphonate catabolism associated alcohol dehydrogenase